MDLVLESRVLGLGFMVNKFQDLDLRLWGLDVKGLGLMV
jgi:hypothetical protein